MGRNRGRPGADDGGVADAGRRPLPDIAHGEHPHRLIDAAQQFIDEQRLRQVETEPRGEIRMAIEFQRLVPPPRSNHTAPGGRCGSWRENEARSSFPKYAVIVQLPVRPDIAPTWIHHGPILSIGATDR